MDFGLAHLNWPSTLMGIIIACHLLYRFISSFILAHNPCCHSIDSEVLTLLHLTVTIFLVFELPGRIRSCLQKLHIFIGCSVACTLFFVM